MTDTQPLVADTPTLEEAASSPASPPPPPASDAEFQATVVGLLTQMSTKLQALDERVEAVESQSGPRFRPMDPETYGNDPSLDLIGKAMDSERHHASRKVPVMADGIKIPEGFIDDFPARFGPDSRVQLNLAAVPHGRTDGKTRGELMAEAGVPNGIGLVIDRTFLTKVISERTGRRGVWKYRVKFPQQTMPGAVHGVVGLHEPELLPV